MNSEEAFLFATFREFYKCWRSSTKARVTIKSVNGKAFVNFSAFQGNPDDAHFKPRPLKWKPSKAGARKKSDKKIKRDNDRAARFQEKKRKDQGEAWNSHLQVQFKRICKESQVSVNLYF